MNGTRVFFAVLFSVAFCACLAAAPAEGKKVRTAFYADTGSRGAGMLQLARVLAHSPGIELVPVTSQAFKT